MHELRGVPFAHGSDGPKITTAEAADFWVSTFRFADLKGERGLKAKSDGESAVHEKEVKDLRAKVGELVLEQEARTPGKLAIGRDETAS